MESISISITEAMLNFSGNIQLGLLFLFSYGEGLPIIGSILPGGTIAILAGSLSESGVFSPISASLIVITGSFLGDMTGFFLGKKARHLKIIKKIIEKETWQKNWEIFDRHVALVAIFGKLIPGIRSAPSILYGARNIKSKQYIYYSFIGSLIWGVVGIFAGNIFAKIFGEKSISIIILILFILVIFTIIKITRDKLKKIL